MTEERYTVKVKVKYNPFYSDMSFLTEDLKWVFPILELAKKNGITLEIDVPSRSSVADDSLKIMYYSRSRTSMNDQETLRKGVDRFNSFISMVSKLFPDADDTMVGRAMISANEILYHECPNRPPDVEEDALHYYKSVGWCTNDEYPSHYVYCPWCGVKLPEVQE